MSFARRRRKYDGRTDRAGDDGANLFGTGLPRWRRLAGPGYPLEENVTTDSGRVPPCAPPAARPPERMATMRVGRKSSSRQREVQGEA